MRRTGVRSKWIGTRGAAVGKDREWCGIWESVGVYALIPFFAHSAQIRDAHGA